MTEIRKNWQYRVVVERSLGELQTVVASLMDHGWKPQGGVAITMRPHPEYHQAMKRAPSYTRP